MLKDIKFENKSFNDHFPVMVREVLENLICDKRGVYVDCTFGLGGHSELLIDNLFPKGKLFAFDDDEESCSLGKQLLKEKNKNLDSFILINDNFTNFDTYLKSFSLKQVDGFLLDLGISTFQLLNEKKGFSYNSNSKLDMRINPKKLLTAYEIVNKFSFEELAYIFLKYGEEHNSKKIAKKICFLRTKREIYSCKDLAQIVASCFSSGVSSIKRKRKHPATKVFQSLRIIVNNELDNLEVFLNKCYSWLKKKNSSLIIISYHSLEDRIVKNKFREWEKTGLFKIITKKPLIPDFKEILLNNRARSAKMRIIKKC